ncbi:hypothetical protein [Microvirga subterranea]|uniref:4-amino-4-deoxy-L-arabinose transferase-like glycosyltransferase n=1 Tax=Microvirga subterranea TaxID=186651 RepID=A0A370HJL6_9HYPH|nr:hypothetical protein [Microvirga subterranea]RDI58550.1 hypothetical protein DES45_10573 [Microvirga subterranea]
MSIEGRKLDLVGIVLFALLIFLIGVRITRGIDLSDEAYYAIFLDDWLKGSIRTSTLLTLHQTAALIVYPATLLYSALKGSSDGLFLFLRVLFLAGAVASAAAWILFLRQLGHRFLAWIGGLFVLAFIPFGLPAPSYNTIGQQALTLALATFACAALTDRDSSARLWWILASACAWALATVAYPSLVVPLGIICVIGLIDRSGIFPQPYLYVSITGIAVCVAWAIVVFSLSFTRLYESIVYLSAINDPGGLTRKWMFTLNLLRANALFSALCVAAIIVGLVRERLDPLVTQVALAVIIAGLFLAKPAFYARSHDVVTLLALAGLGFLTGLRDNAGLAERVSAVVYGTSLAAALITCLTATNAVFNFSIGAIPAAAIALVGRPSPESRSWFSVLPVCVATVAVLSTSLYFYYGEAPTKPKRMRIHLDHGFFAGLSVQPHDATLLNLVQAHIVPMSDRDKTAAVIGRLPGIALAMPSRLSMLSSFPLMPDVPQKGLAMTHDFYTNPDNRPDLVLIYKDPFFEPVNPMQPHFEEWYAPVADIETPLGHLAVYRRRSMGE